MKAPQRVVWTQGMLMAPQHLQQLDRYHEMLVSARVGAIVPFDWGVLTVEIDQRALSAGQMRLQKFAGVLPDGLPLAFDDNHPEAPPARPIEGHFGPMARVLEVYLGVPNEREGVANYSNGSSPTQGTRFFVTNRATFDATIGASETAVSFAQRNVTLLFGDEPRENFDAIKVAEIVRDSAGTLVLREGFVPPCRRISASPFIVSGLRKILSSMAAKQRTLAETRRQRDAATVEFGPGDVTRFLLLNSINTFLPVIAYLVDAADTSPEDVYLLCSQFAGQLSSFAVDADPTTLPKFVYGDLGATFEALFARIMALLGMTVKQAFIVVPLESRDDGLHFGRLEDDRLLKTNTYILTVKSEVPEPQVADQLPKLSKIASWTDVGEIVHAATPGVSLAVTYRPPAEIPVKAGLVYFQLNTSDRYWRNIAAERTLAIYLPPPFDPSHIKLELLAVPPPEDGRCSAEAAPPWFNDRAVSIGVSFLALEVVVTTLRNASIDAPAPVRSRKDG